MPKVLTDAQVRSFHDSGFLTPVRAMSAERAQGYRERFERLLTETRRSYERACLIRASPHRR